jgi:hypothetical protein
MRWNVDSRELNAELLSLTDNWQPIEGGAGRGEGHEFNG